MMIEEAAVLAQIPWAGRFADKHLRLLRSGGIHFERSDLKSAALFGLAQAAARFKPEFGATFPSFASIRMRGAIQDFVKDSGLQTGPGTQFVKAQRMPFQQMSEPDRLSGGFKSECQHDCVGRVFSALESLTPRSRTIMEMKYFLGYNQHEIAQSLGVSDCLISHLHAAAINAMRESLAARGIRSMGDLL